MGVDFYHHKALEDLSPNPSSLTYPETNEEAMYAVVTVEDSDEVIVAASDWLSSDKTQCYWPPFKSQEKCTEAVKNRLVPSTNGKWEMLNIIFHGEYATFEQANERKEGIKQRERIFATGLIKRQKHEMPKNPSIVPFNMSTDDKDEILQMLREIKSKIDENSSMLKKLLKDTPVSDPAPSSTSTQSKDMKSNLNLPLQSTEDVQRIERELKVATTRKKYLNYLSGLGGFGPRDVIKNIMQHVLTNDLVKEFNWQGRGDKKPFSHLILVDVIKDAASKKNITTEDCKAEIKKYLTNTNYRLKKKRQREEGYLLPSADPTGFSQLYLEDASQPNSPDLDSRVWMI